MREPTNAELNEFTALYNEFAKDTNVGAHPTCTDTLRRLSVEVSCLPEDDSVRLHYNRLVRYDRYKELCIICAGFFYRESFFHEPQDVPVAFRYSCTIQMNAATSMDIYNMLYRLISFNWSKDRPGITVVDTPVLHYELTWNDRGEIV